MASRIFGSGIRRREDPRLITGQARYTDDFTLPNMAHLAVVRSPYAHAKIKKIDTKKARRVPGVVGGNIEAWTVNQWQGTAIVRKVPSSSICGSRPKSSYR